MVTLIAPWKEGGCNKNEIAKSIGTEKKLILLNIFFILERDTLIFLCY